MQQSLPALPTLGQIAGASINTVGVMIGLNYTYDKKQTQDYNTLKTNVYLDKRFQDTQYIPVYRAMNSIELGVTTKHQEYRLGKGVMESKQFVFNPNEAISFANYFSDKGNKLSYGVVTSMVSKNTLLYADIDWTIDRDRVNGPVATFRQNGLIKLNQDARRTGGIKILCIIPNC